MMNDPSPAPPPANLGVLAIVRERIADIFATFGNHIEIAVQAWRDDRAESRSARNRANASREELQFMPAALEIMETPASPLGRGMALAISGLLLIAILWASFGKLDTHATASSQLISAGRTKIIQSLDIGVVKSIHVADGQIVRQGDLLIQLDSTATAADADRIESDLAELRLSSARLKALFADPVNPQARFAPPLGASRAAVDLHERLMRSASEEQAARRLALANQLKQRANERRSIETNISRLRATIPLLEERVAGVKSLADQGHFPRLRYLELLQDQIDKQKELEAQAYKLAEIDSAMSALEEQAHQAAAEFRRTVLDQLKDVEGKISSAEQELIKARQRDTLTQLIAPIDGVVQQLSVHTVGGVVRPADPLMVIVPGGNRLELEAKVLNRDVGFVHPGQHVEIKLETFPFTKYGTISGRVVSVSGDAVMDEKLGPLYLARISVERSTMRVEDGEVPLSPGMAATAEIKTGQRRVIEYVLAPLFRYRDEAWRER